MGHIGQKQPVVADAGSDPLVWFVPPVLYVSFGKLVGRCPEQMLPHQLRRHPYQGQAILQLVTEAIGLSLIHI